MFGVSHLPELLLILVVALVIFGPKRLPEIGSSMGKTIKEFKRSTQEDDDKQLTDERKPVDQTTHQV
jgi:sec-independent protein translocase protein TatA